MILGIDEVGRGCLAGPLVVGAVVLSESHGIEGLADSKKLTKNKREMINAEIRKKAEGFGLGWIFPDEIDEIGISSALVEATKRAVMAIECSYSQIIIDGTVNFLNGTKKGEHVSTLVKADTLIAEVSAASIIAKVARDSYMMSEAKKYPNYGFESHVGYGTKKHLEAISNFGACNIHRKSFRPISEMVGFDKDYKNKVVKNTTKIGQLSENTVRSFLKSKGHQIVSQNWKSKYCEIDIVSVKDDQLFFTEVKHRSDDCFGLGLEAINEKKLEQMYFAVKYFLSSYPKMKRLAPKILAVSTKLVKEIKKTSSYLPEDFEIDEIVEL